MGNTRDKLEAWVHDYLRPRYPELELPLMRAINAFDAINESGRITPELLAPIVEAASSHHRPLSENATDFLSELTGEFVEACEAVELMAQDPRSHIRFNAILCLGSSTPLSLVGKILRQALTDKSVRVREKAADWAGRLHFGQIIPDLEIATAKEQHLKTKQCMDFELKLLRDGYILKESSKGRFMVSVRTNRGIALRSASRQEIEERGIDAIVAEVVQRG